MRRGALLVVYVGSLWYYDEVGHPAFPFAAGVIIGIGSGMVFITAGYIQLAYPEEKEKGMYITMVNNIQACGSVIGGFIPLVINRNSATSGGVPRAGYISFIVIMICAALLGLLILPPQKLRRDDGSVVAVYKARPPWEELKDNLLIFTDWKLMIMLPAFLSAESFLVYVGAVNGKFTQSGLSRLRDADTRQSTTTTSELVVCSGSWQPCSRFRSGLPCRWFWIARPGVEKSADSSD